MGRQARSAPRRFQTAVRSTPVSKRHVRAGSADLALRAECAAGSAGRS